MKRLLYTLLLLFIFTLPSISQTYKDIHPAYLGIKLIDEPTVDDMRTTCEYYNLEEQDAEGDYTVYKHPDGTILKFKINYENRRKFPEVTILTSVNKKDIEKILSETGYKEESGTFYKGSKFELRRTKCEFNSGAISNLIKEYNEV